jgi:RsiW-degrading membrane proteinase PrsW (M82 family)
MNPSYGILRIVQQEDHERHASPSASQQAGLGAWELPGYAGNPIGLPDTLYPIIEASTSIGRGLNNHIVLMDPLVSREHARLTWHTGHWLIENLSDHAPLQLDSSNLPPGQMHEIAPGASFTLGQTTLQLLAPLPEAVSQISKPEMPAATPDLIRGRVPDAAPDVPSERASALADHAEAFAGLDSPLQTRHLLGMSPGVTIQFAMRERLDRGRFWAIATGAILLASLLICLGFGYLTISRQAQISQQLIAHGRLTSALAAITLPLVSALSIVLLVNLMDRYEREPWLLRLGAFLWGAIIAIPPAFLVERTIENGISSIQFGWLSRTGAEVAHSLLLGANAGITEETIKGAGLILLLLALRDEFDNVTDGIIYGALIGAGFAMIENIVYLSSSDNQSLLFLIIGRIVLGWLGHSTFTACLGAGLGYARQTRIPWQKWAMPLLGFGVGVFLHTLFDFVNFQAKAAIFDAPNSDFVTTLAISAIIANYIPPFLAQGTILYLLMRSLNHEAAIIRHYLADEVLHGVGTPDEYLLLQRSFRRTRLERFYLFKRGWRAWLTAKALYQTQIGLAFRKWHVSMGDTPKPGREQPEDAYRERIRQLREELLKLSMPAPALAPVP